MSLSCTFSSGKYSLSDHIIKVFFLVQNVLLSLEKHFVYFKVLLFKGVIQICDYSFTRDA